MEDGVYDDHVGHGGGDGCDDHGHQGHHSGVDGDDGAGHANDLTF